MMIAANAPVWPGNSLDFELRLDRGPGVPVRGHVVELVAHRGMLAMRIRFEELGPEGRRAVAAWMARQ
jgi:hypothetical protein